MMLRKVLDVTDQIVGSGFSSTELRNKVIYTREQYTVLLTSFLNSVMFENPL